MQKIINLSLILITFLSQTAFAKPFSYIEKVETPLNLSGTEIDIAEEVLACNIQSNLFEHLLLMREIFPRVHKELDYLTVPQRNNQLGYFQVAEKVDSGDLFHAHVRVPLVFMRSAKKRKLHSMFYNSRLYHLQYHSFETGEFYTNSWVRELYQLNLSDLKHWLKKREDFLDNRKKHQSMFEYTHKEFEGSVEKLTESDRLRYSLAWYESFYKKNNDSIEKKKWMLKRLNEKLRALDPGDFLYDMSFLKHRSVFSTDKNFVAMRPLNIDGFSQPSTFYFEEREDNDFIEKVIKEAKADGLNYIINQYHSNFSKSSFPAEFPWELHKKYAAKLRAAAKKSLNPLYMYKEKLESDSDFKNHYIFSWDDKYLYSVRYFLPCHESTSFNKVNDKTFFDLLDIDSILESSVEQ